MREVASTFFRVYLGSLISLIKCGFKEADEWMISSAFLLLSFASYFPISVRTSRVQLRFCSCENMIA